MTIKVDRSNVRTEATSTERGVQFLSPNHTNSAGKLAKITKVNTPDNKGKSDNYGNPYVVYFTMDGQKYSKGFKPTSDNLAVLVELFGEDESKWIGQPVIIARTDDEDSGPRLAFSKPKAGKQAIK
jgi:hypothetical protein